MEIKTSVPPIARKLFIATPSYNGWQRCEMYEGLRRPTETADWIVKPRVGSLLAYTFNQLLHTCYNSRRRGFGWNRFLMHHADISAPPLFADVMMDEMDRTGADVLSVVVPIKDDRALTSTGLALPDDNVRRLTMKEIFNKLPETFDTSVVADVFNAPASYLSVNTGLMLCNFDRIAPFMRPGAMNENDPGLFFSVLDGVREEENGDLITCVLPEDWNFSRACRQRGLKVFATRKISLMHHGDGQYPNDSPWGDWETDLGDDPGKWPKEQAEKRQAVERSEAGTQKGWARIPVAV